MSQLERISVVPSGKVYGQLFEAQAFLSRKLTESELQRSESKQKSSSDQLNALIAHKLSDRVSKEETVPRKIQNFPEIKKEQSLLTAEVCEVKALPEIIVYKHSSSDIARKIKERRLNLHEKTLEDMYQDLGVINSNVEVKLEKCCKVFSEKVANIDTFTEKLLEIDESDKKLMSYTFEEFNKLRAKIQSHTECKQKYIHHLDYQFNEVETDRITKIQSVLKKYTASFEEIAYLTTPEVHRLMETETQIINQTLLNNKQSYTDIYTQLLLVNIEQDRKQHLNWKSVMTLWKNKNIQLILERFRQFMLTSAYTKPQQVQTLLEQITIKLANILNEYKELLKFLRNFVPPKCTKALVEEWSGKVNDVTERLKKEKIEFLARINDEYEKCNQLCLAKMQEEEVALVDCHACTVEKASELSAKYMLPLIQLQQKNFECSMSTWDDDVTKEILCTTKNLNKVYAYITAIADIWLEHTQELDAQEQKLNQMLAEVRDKYAVENQADEAKLDAVLDVLRQGADASVLESQLNTAISMLTRLKISYQSFHAKLMTITSLFTPMVKEKLNQYEKAICKFFKLEKFVKQSFSQVAPSEECNYIEPADTADTASTSNESTKKYSLKSAMPLYQQTPKSSIVTEKSSNLFMDSQGAKPQTMDRMLVTQQNTQYYCEASSIESNSFVDEQELVAKQMHIPSEYISDIKTNICMNMLNHLDLWLMEAVKNARHSINVKIDELDAELNLRIHLHKPRAKRIEEDIHDVRKEELLLHSKRIADHCQGVEDAFISMRKKLDNIKENQDALMANFELQLDGMEPAFLTISKSEKLVTLRNNLTLKINKLMADIRKILREYRSDFDRELHKVKDSNALLMKSLKPFSERGNFCPEEIQQYQKIIDKFGSRVDQFEGKILTEMEWMETSRYEQATKITLIFEERFKNHVFDLQFIELIARWFTNTQVKVKCDVAKCNSQGKDTSNILETFEKKIDYLTEPHPDKLKCSPSELIGDLSTALTQFCSRAVYLIGPRCIKESAAFKLGVLQIPSDIPAICKAGRLWIDDPSVIAAKHILRSNKFLSSSEGSLIQKGEKSDGTTTDAVGSTASYTADPKRNLSTKKSLTQLRRHQTVYAAQDLDSKAVFEQMYRLGKIKKMLLSHKIRQKLFTGDAEVKENEDGELEIAYDFLGTIRQYLQITFDNVLLIADDYYRVKGVRPVTRPQVIQDNVESCATLMKKKLKGYYSQAVEFNSRCQTEFSKQVQRLESIASKIPKFVMDQHFKDHTNCIEVMSKEKLKVFEAGLEEFQAKQASNREQLQPNLGHPQMKEKLNKLNENENEQHEALIAFMKSHFMELTAEVIKASGPFLKELCTISESLLQLYDYLFKDTLQKKDNKVKITPADVYGLIKNVPQHDRATWTGLPLKEFYTQMSLESPFPKAVSASVTTSKSMFPHHETVRARNQTFQVYKEFFKNTLQQIEIEEKDVLEREMKRWANWQASVKNIQNLYK